VDPEEIQETGVFFLLAVVMMIFTKGQAGEYRDLIDILIMVLLVAGIAVTLYGFFLAESRKRGLKK